MAGRAGGEAAREGGGAGARYGRCEQGEHGAHGLERSPFIGGARVARTPRKWRRRATPKLDQAGHM